MTLKKNFSFLPLIIVSIILVIMAVVLFTRRVPRPMRYQVSNIQELVSLFPKNANDIKQRSQQVMKDVEEQIKKIINIKNDERTFDNTVREYDKISYFMTPVAGSISALENLSPEKELRDVAHETLLKLSDFAVDRISLNVDLYKAFKAYANENAKKENLNDTQKYYINEVMSAFKRHGLDLPEEKLNQLKKLTKDLSALFLEFAANIAQDNCKISVQESDLKGLTKNFINSLNKDKNGNYILTCDYPTYFNVMDNCEVESTREKFYLTFNNRAYPKNIEILEKIIEKRDQVAKLVGYESFSHLKLDEQMAKSPEKVEKFLDDLIAKATDKATKEIKTFLKDLPESINLTDEGKIKPWDIAFLKNYYKKKYLKLDENKVSEYFPLDHTVKQLLNIYEKFFSIKFEEIPAKGFWHEEVKLIKVYDNKNNLLGYLLLDLHPRENKFSHAAHSTIIDSIQDKNGKNNISVSIVMANFPKPTKDEPALLKLDDVVTFFHEFGHALHALLGRTELYSNAGTNTKMDFVEMPSQMLEDWLKDKEILKMVSKHFKNEVPLPDDMIDTIVQLEKFDSGNSTLRQIYFSLLSLNYYDKGEKKDTNKISEELYKKLLKDFKWIPEAHFQSSFGHLTDYGPSYYGYLWSNVFAKDLFAEIKKYGLLDPEIGQKYIKEVIGKGGSQDPNDLLKNFLGREPSSEAFFKDLGFE